jgi:uncharacterized SAM-binding protein YcdF (DUF218 family)
VLTVTQLIRYLAPLGQPVGLLWLFTLLAAVFLLWRRKWLGGFTVLILAGLMYLIGSPSLARRLMTALEQPYARAGLNELPAVDAVVVLGGGHGVSQHDVFGFVLMDGAQRVLTGLELMRQHKGRVLVLGGGYYMAGEQKRPRSELLQNWLKAWDLPGTPVFTLGTALNTREEAENAQKLAKEQNWRRLILVTSASHMKRAEAVFKNVGLSVICVACDFRAYGVPDEDSSCPFIPRMGNFELWSNYLHEEIGWLIYRWRGWTTDNSERPAAPDSGPAKKSGV